MRVPLGVQDLTTAHIVACFFALRFAAHHDQIGTICSNVHNRVGSSWSTLERDLITAAFVWTCTAVAPLACALRLVER